MKKNITKLMLVIILLGSIKSIYAEMSADEIAVKSQEVFFYQAADMKANVSMRLVNREGKERQRKLIMLRKNLANREQKFFIYFEKPQDFRDMTFMVHKLPDKDDLRWLFIPALKMVRRIASSDKHSSFVGSDFTYEDISGRDISLDNYKLLRKEKLNGIDCFVIQSIPKEEDKFSRKLSWIDGEKFLPRKEEYYNSSDELEKVFTAEEIKDIDGFPTIMKRIMKDVKTGNYTEVLYNNIKYNIGIGDDLFEERFMQNPQRRYLE
ncbi:outer membrane lipoprotein-sorting protein [Candidatus Desantisbacteria bacterium]|nr:outer membrane lipoprotein-sorting protein [Candidatus Desantisbacteria bacterium]